MIYSFKSGNDEYIHLVSGLIREELGKTLTRIRKEKNLSIREVSQTNRLNLPMLHSLEQNTKRNGWINFKKTAEKYGYDLMIRLKFSVDVTACEKHKPKEHNKQNN